MVTAAGLTVAAVARRLGVAPATLRTWDRRYGLGPREHSGGSHRRYLPDDVARLDLMRRLVAQGVSPGDAAAAALAGAPPEPADEPPVPGAAVLDAGTAETAVRGLTRAALALDGAEVADGVTALLAAHGVVATWERVLVPVLVAAGLRWETTGKGVDVEHVLSDAISTALLRTAPDAPAESRRVLLACAPDDQHSLPLRALAAALEQAGHGSRFLGAAVPPDALRAAVRRTGPVVLLVWSQRPETADPALLELPVTRPQTRVVAAGPGWPAELPDGVLRAGSLGAATDLLGRVVRGKPIPSRA